MRTRLRRGCIFLEFTSNPFCNQKPLRAIIHQAGSRKRSYYPRIRGWDHNRQPAKGTGTGLRLDSTNGRGTTPIYFRDGFLNATGVGTAATSYVSTSSTTAQLAVVPLLAHLKSPETAMQPAAKQEHWYGRRHNYRISANALAPFYW